MPRRLVLALVLTVFALTAGACGGGEEAAPTAEEVVGTVETQAATTEETTTEAAGGATTEDEGETGATTGGDEAAGDAEAGKSIFAAQGCGGCHTLQAAGATGTVGPNLDDSKPSFDKAVERVTKGGNGMPAFGDQLSDEQIRNVAAFVVESPRG